MRFPIALVGLVCSLLSAGGCGPHPDDLDLVGTVERDVFELVAPVSETLVVVNVKRGDAVAKGQLLVELDTTLAQAEMARAEAVLAGARTGATVAGHELQRLRKLRRSRVASEQDLERAQLARDEASARLREAEALLAASSKRLRDLSIVSPVAGVVDQLPFDLGERVPAGAVVSVVIGLGDPWVRVWIPERSFARVLPGTPASVRVDGLDRDLAGSVLDVSREPEFTPHFALTERDRVHLVYETRVRIHDAPSSLRPGVPAQVRILPEPAPGAGIGRLEP